MNLNVQELERGIKEGLEKEGFLNMIPGFSQMNQGLSTINNLTSGLDKLNKGIDYVTGGGLMNDVGTAAMGILPIVGMMGGKGGKGGAVGQNININLGNSTPRLGTAPGQVGTFAQMSQAAAINKGSTSPNVKVSGLLDLGLLRTVLTARTANEMIDSVKADNPDEKQINPAPSAPVNNSQIELVSKYPEMQKILADPQSRAYLESLLTKQTGYGT